jgi:hypothetical protein
MPRKRHKPEEIVYRSTVFEAPICAYAAIGIGPI